MLLGRLLPLCLHRPGSVDPNASGPTAVEPRARRGGGRAGGGDDSGVVGVRAGRSFRAVGDHAVRPAADLLLLAVVLGVVTLFRWQPPPSLWLLAGSLLVFGSADCIYAIQAARDSYEIGGLVDAAWMVAVTAVALAPGWDKRQGIARVPAAWLPLAAPLIAAAAAISVLVAASYAHAQSRGSGIWRWRRCWLR